MRKLRHTYLLAVFTIGVLVVLCLPAQAHAQRIPPFAQRVLEEQRKMRAEQEGREYEGPGDEPTSPSARRVASNPGSDETTTGSPAPQRMAPRTPLDAKVSFDFRDYDLMELVNRISEMTGLNFILTDTLQGKKVTIISPTKITVEEAYQVFLSVLKSAGYAVVPIGSSLKIVPVGQVSSEAIPTVVENFGPNENFVTRLFKVKNIEVEQMAGALSKLVSPNGSVITYAPTNTLIMTDTVTNIERIVDIIQRLDVESPTERLVIIPIRYADATDIAEKLMEVFGVGEQVTAQARRSRAKPPSSRRRGRSRRSPARDAASTTSMGQETPSISKIIADERTNALIIMATAKALQDITALITKLDVDVDENLKSDIHVIYLKYAKAEELAATLANLAGGGYGGGVSTSRGTSRTSSSRNTRPGSRSSQFGRNRNTRQGGYRGAGGGFGGDVATFEGGVRVTADPPTNALVITASYNDYLTLRRVIERLDIRRKQVFVEAVILELSQDKSSTIGINYHGGIPGAEEGTGALLARGAQSLFASDPNLLAGLAVGVFGATVSAPGTLGSALGSLTGTDASSVQIPAFGIVLQALQQDKDVNILSTPSILTSNNEEAKIVVGQNIPFQSGSTISTIGSNISITREDVALTLRITPQVNESDEVTLEVFQEITEVVPGTTSNPLGPTTTKRSAETVVSVPDNHTAVIGGLIAAKENVAEDKVPILGDIPLIGVLFRTRTKTISKSNLLIFLTPHIIDTEEDMMNVYRIKMAQRQEFVRRFYGKTQEEQLKELEALMKYSMNLPDEPPIYPERTQRRSMEATIETSGQRRGYIAPIPGVNPNADETVVVPVLTEPEPEEVPEQPGGATPAPEGPGAGQQGTGSPEGTSPAHETTPEPAALETGDTPAPPPEETAPTTSGVGVGGPGTGQDARPDEE